MLMSMQNNWNACLLLVGRENGTSTPASGLTFLKTQVKYTLTI